ncbi:lipoprotein [Budviciaceae bacterium BWR-B9]|uniref:Type IV secretion system putative lipoprotein virB7 n=1 Tax=Limnobaculum allomyrinae TaxID=2791986 RepID=A0ABS1IWE3_9GAMM|nr:MULTISPECIES: lipoprotein [Limnobaculum]MBK5146014.1 lipoprotein [Limnobaculum allomyrinae]MBV7694055.1 lipoprotein [Limnobaculum sp. M2-1]
MRKIVLFISILFILSGCASVQEKSISTKLSARAYNSVAKAYMPMLTSASVVTYGDKEYIKYLIDLYSYSEFGKDRFYLALDKDGADTAINIIDKYLKWESIAKRDSDIVDKEMQELSGPKYLSVAYKFGMASGNERNHYLYIQQCSDGLMSICLYSVYLNKEDALILKDELGRYLSGSLKVTDDSKYQ